MAWVETRNNGFINSKLMESLHLKSEKFDESTEWSIVACSSGTIYTVLDKIKTKEEAIESLEKLVEQL